MKEKYIKLESVLAALYSNKRIDDNGDIDAKAITDILNLPTKEIEANQEPDLINNLDDLLKVLKDPPYNDYDFRDFTSINAKSYIPKTCRSCPNHPSNGGSGNCQCILGTQVTY